MRKTCSSYKLWFVVIFCIAIFGVVYHRLFELQIRKHEYYFERQKNHNLSTFITSRRNILDRNHQILVTNTSRLEVILYLDDNNVIEISNIPSRLGFFEQLVKFLPIWSFETLDRGHFNERLKERLSDKYSVFASERIHGERPLLFIGNLRVSLEDHIRSIVVDEIQSYSETFSGSIRPRVRSILSRHARNNIRYDIRPERTYLYDATASHVLGYINMAGPQKGAEFFLDSIISQEEHSVHWRDLASIRAGRENRSQQNIEKGDVVLTIDLDIQARAEKILREQLERVGAPKGIAIVMDPNNGEIIALANYPDYNPGNVGVYYQTTVNHERFKNLSLEEPFEPGSILKVFPIAAALEEKIIDVDTEFQLHNGIYRFSSIRKTLEDTRHFKSGTVRDIIKYSSNIGMGKIAMEMEPQTLYDYLKKFQLDENYNIYAYNQDTLYLSWSRQGIYPLSNWSRQSRVMVSIGHEVAFSGIQVLSSFNALVNGGIFYSPHVVKKIINPEGVEIIPDNYISMRVIEPQTSHELRYMMQSVTEYNSQYQFRGTGHQARFINYPHVTTGGKTGTAMYFDLDLGKYHASRYVSSFIGFFPVENPRYTILTTVFFPTYDKRYGSESAAPIFREIGEMILTVENEKTMGK